MQYEPTTPQQDGFSMPAEFSPHQGCILIWPERPGSWKNGAAAARKAFRSVIAAIAESETVYVAVNPHSRPSAERMLAGMANVRLLDLDSDDAWARDVAPTFVRRAADGAVRGVNWRFNAWGGEVDGLYAHWEKDDAFAGGLLDMLYREAKVESVEYSETIDIVAVCPPKVLGQIGDYTPDWTPPKEDWE